MGQNRANYTITAIWLSIEPEQASMGVRGQVTVEDKPNEITASFKLPRVLELAG